MDAFHLPPSLESALFLGLVFAALFTLAAFALVALQIWSILRPKTDLFVTRPEFDGLKEEIEKNRATSEKHFAELTTQVGALQKSWSHISADIMRAIGRLEGHNEKKEAA